MSIIHHIFGNIFSAFESKQARYHRECEEAFRRSQQEHNDAGFSKQQ